MLIIDPTQGRTQANATAAVDDVGSRLLGRVCLYSNSKPNASALLTGVATGLGLHRVPMFAKPSASTPAPAGLLDRIAASFDAALVAIGD